MPQLCEKAMTPLPIWMDGLTPQMVAIAEKELGETEEVRTQALKDLKRLINAEEDFRPLRDDGFLLRFLRCKKFDVQKAFNTLKNHYTFKVRYSGILTDFTPSQLKKVLESNTMFPLPKRLPDGSAVGVLRIGHFNLNDGSAEDLFATCLMCIELGLDLSATQVCGGHVIFDFDNFGLRHLKHFAPPTFLLRLMRLIQDCIPVRVKSLHVVNEPFFFTVMLNVLKQAATEKIKSRAHFHGRNIQSLHKFFPPENLPLELGGTLGPADNTDLRKRVLDCEAYFEKLNKYGYLEKKAQFIKRRSSRSLGLFI